MRFVEADKEVQAYRLRGGGGPLTVTTDVEIHLGHFALGENDSTPFTERHHVQADGSFSVLDGLRMCPEGVLIDRLGMSFTLFIESEEMDDESAMVRLSLDATVALLNERLVFS
jgi:hypothetical protein